MPSKERIILSRQDTSNNTHGIQNRNNKPEFFFCIWQISEIVRRTSIQVGNQMGIKMNVWQIRVKEG
jgi:hypothetical protein